MSEFLGNLLRDGDYFAGNILESTFQKREETEQKEELNCNSAPIKVSADPKSFLNRDVTVDLS